jgi:hypothetical protein
MDLPITIPPEEQKKFEKWSSLLQRLFMSANTNIAIMDETAKFLFMRGLSPLEALLATKSIEALTQADPDNMPFDEGSEYSLGTQVVKIKSAPGDYTEDGAKGIVRGHRKLENYGSMYFVEWEGYVTSLGEPVFNGVRAASLKEVTHEL